MLSEEALQWIQLTQWADDLLPADSSALCKQADRHSASKSKRANSEHISRQHCFKCLATSLTHVIDEQSESVVSLGKSHAEAVLTETNCSHCESMSLGFFQRAAPPLALSRSLPPRNLGGTNNGARGLSSQAGADPACLTLPTQRGFSCALFYVLTSAPLLVRAAWFCLGDLKRIFLMTACHLQLQHGGLVKLDG